MNVTKGVAKTAHLITLLDNLREQDKIPRCSTYHELKTAKKFFGDMWDGIKTFEVRFNDRKYKKGDVINLRERCYSKYTNREMVVIITHVLKSFKGLQKGYVVFSFEIIEKNDIVPIKKSRKKKTTKKKKR